MTPEGGDDRDGLLRAHGESAIAAEVESAELGPRNRHFRCPSPSCASKGPSRGRNAAWFSGEGGIWRWKCFSCEGGGTLIDLLMATRGFSVAAALAHLRGQTVSAPPPRLHVVQPQQASADPKKLTPPEVKSIWEAMTRDDAHGSAYVEGRGISGEYFVRYATEKHTNAAVKRNVRQGRRVAMLLSDVVGNPRGVQLRLAREPMAKEPKQMTLDGSTAAGAFFGQPELIEASPVVCVAEGICDTLAVAQWSELRACVVGAPGMSMLPRLASELHAAGIVLDGKVFALFPQNDRPLNKSRLHFRRLALELAQLGAQCVMVSTPEDFKDVALWRQQQPGAHWPPAELARVLGDEAEHESPATELVTPDGAAVAVPRLFTTDSYSQDLTTLLALLDDQVQREAITGRRGELRLSKMTDSPFLGDSEVGPSDITAIRVGLEREGRTLASKRLKFERKQVMEALHLLASRKRFHPLTDWVKSLRWSGKRLLDVELPHAMGQELDSLEARLVRKWLLAAAARALVPGCKADNVLVLVGPQGCGKSRFCRAIGGQWFTDSAVNVDDDDSKRKMRGAWIVEWAELSSMRRARDQESIKDFLTKTFDEYRPLYVEAMLRADRHSLFVGTTNSEEFLSDPTGNRRFWPVRVEGVDVAWVEKNREQLVAEAAHFVVAGEQWWLEDGDERALIGHNKQHEVEDAWMPLVREHWEAHPNWVETTTEEILRSVIEKKKEHWSSGELQRVARILTALQWRQGPRKYVPGTKERPRVWYPPQNSGSK